MLLNSLTVLIYGPGKWKSNMKTTVDVNLLRIQQLHLGTLNATSVLFKHQNHLRKILRQRCPTISRYSSNESISENVSNVDALSLTKSDQTTGEKKLLVEVNQKSDMNNFAVPTDNERDEDEDEDIEEDGDRLNSSNGLLIQDILARATQTNPLKSIYSYAELSLAALNLTQQLAANLYAENSLPYYTNADAQGMGAISKPPLPPVQPTLIHGVPIYNDAVRKHPILRH